MNRLSIILGGVMILAATTGCVKEQSTPERQQQNVVYNNTTVINGVQLMTHYYTVQPSQWQSANNVDYVYASFENVDITANVIENGCVICYFVDSDGRDNPMPYEFYRSYIDDNTGNEIFYAETFSYDVEENSITFKFQASDFDTQTSIAQYGNMSFKVCVLDPQTE